MDRRSFLQMLGAMAAAGTLAGPVAALLEEAPREDLDLPVEAPGLTPWDRSPPDDIYNDIIRSMSQLQVPTLLYVSDRTWRELVAAVEMYHPELLVAKTA